MKRVIDRVVAWCNEDFDLEIPRTMFAVMVLIVVPGFGLTLGVIEVIDTGHPLWLTPLAVPVLYGVWRFIKWLFKIERKSNDGSNREAEEDPQDSSSSAWAGAVASARAVTPTSALSGASFAFTQHVTRSSANLEAPKEEPLEVVESDLPILAHRSALLRFGGTDKHWASVNEGFGSFGVDADATCKQNRFTITSSDLGYGFHKAPVVSCDCGFYALPTDLRSTWEGHSYVTLMVELSGTVIEHDEGYRGQHQRVVECELPPCPFCGSQAEQVIVGPENRMHEAVCSRHVPVLAEGCVTVSFDDVAALLPVPVTRAGKRVDA